MKIVAPARERGLKYSRRYNSVSNGRCRSREGAWIEIENIVGYFARFESLPRGSVD